MYLLGRMVLNGGTYGGRRYLTEASVAQMTSNQVGAFFPNPDYGYGFGWIVHRLNPPGDPTAPGAYGAGVRLQHRHGDRSRPQWLDLRS